MGRRKAFNRIKLIKAIKNSNGIITIIADRLGVCRQTVSKALKNDPIAQEYYEDECDTVLDIAEVVIIDAIKNQDVNTAKWYLSTKGGKRGYNPRMELESKVDNAITLNFMDKEGGNFGDKGESDEK